MKRMRGVTLVEALVIMAVGSVIAGLSIKILHQSQQNVRDAQNWMALQRGAAEWETKLRADLREATSARLDDESTLVVQRKMSSITYVVLEDRVERSAEKEGMLVSTEGYLLPECEITITLPESDLVVVDLEPNRRMKSSRTFTIRQSVGRR
ncbi:type II secretion system protein J [Blastopirellula marina]|uniref:Prepilin-type cleavage/methylation domain-containing protein n=1 Tax=Blastopirellula marina TaxID=124 RepID=A0A2S8GQ37_9BACT|nr:prepilin-type N-terminal cleavage/methylation domain-containing protein [Blastopirellula marina]PQO46546.1 hypothetical protein C5Y93_08720 [Blastopirellula marina]